MDFGPLLSIFEIFTGLVKAYFDPFLTIKLEANIITERFNLLVSLVPNLKSKPSHSRLSLTHNFPITTYNL